MIPTPEVPLRMPKSPSPTLGMSDHSQPLLYNMNFLSFARIASMSGHVQNSILLEIREANRVEFPLETLESWQDSHEGSYVQYAPVDVFQPVKLGLSMRTKTRNHLPNYGRDSSTL